MSKDLYQVLGVERTATDDEIRAAYRKLAKELHPDLNPGDAKAADRFKEVSAAYDLLKDPEKRGRYDRGEIDESGMERPKERFYRDYAETGGGRTYHSTAGFEDFEDLSDIFGDLFGQRGRRTGGQQTFRMRGQDVHYRLEVGFLEAVRGARKRVTMPDGKDLDISIPEGVQDGQTLRLKGKGRPGAGGGPDGDAYIEISVSPHPYFSREGDDILLEVPIGPDEAVLGTKIDVPTVTGKVSLTIPKNMSSGHVLRLKGKGVRRKKGSYGDQLVRVRIVVPKQEDAELAEFMKRWREKNKFDPRADWRVS